MNELEISTVCKTSITRKYVDGSVYGRAIGEAIVPAIAISLANNDDLILDFGAGKHPYYVMKYRNEGYDIFGWDFPETMKFWKQEYPDEEITPDLDLMNQFDLVYASNVLNVAPNEIFLREETLDNIKKVIKHNGICVCNYPQNPRKNSELTTKKLFSILNEYFRIVKYDPKKLVFVCQYLL